MKKKFGPAFRGLLDGWKDAGIRTQMILGVLAVCAGIILKLDAAEWLAVIICISAVIAAEMINTAIERVCDLITEEYDERIRLIKDLSAGAVLAVSIGALAAAVLILVRHLGG